MSDYITVTGNVATVPEQAQLPGGVPVVRFRLASTQRRQENGTWVDCHTNWYRVSVYRKLALHALDSIEKGQRVIVTGRFKLNSWDSNGKSGMSADIDADALGHDLLFGTARFQRDVPRAVPSEPPQASVDGDGWAVAEIPGGETPATTAVAEPRESAQPEREPVLAGAGDWHAPRADDTPF
ncbi:single-stranded DNA-binding protein [Microbacterium sp.]|uniref:single-stranded DNA-binding protein n=1 Tax=Microbacterium sp. TaxID=51671 RepID=UPI0039E30A40